MATTSASNSFLRLGMVVTKWASIGLSLVAAGIFGFWDFRNSLDAFARGNNKAGKLFMISAFTGILGTIALIASSMLIGFILIAIFIVTQFLLSNYNTTKLQDWFKYSYFGKASKNWSFEQEVKAFDLALVK